MAGVAADAAVELVEDAIVFVQVAQLQVASGQVLIPGHYSTVAAVTAEICTLAQCGSGGAQNRQQLQCRTGGPQRYANLTAKAPLNLLTLRQLYNVLEIAKLCTWLRRFSWMGYTATGLFSMLRSHSFTVM